ncbi:MAG: DUF2924 domain-containing protein [bacterium]
MIATKTNRVSRALARQAAEVDLALSVADAPKSDAPIVSKKPRLRGRARAAVAQTIEGPSSKRPPTLSPGTKLVREFKGRKIVVVVLDEKRFEWNGKVYRSLSKLAGEITGSHLSGPRWFGIVAPRKEKP